MKILMIDSDEKEMKRIAGIIKRSMYDVIVTGYYTNMTDAVNVVKIQPPDVVIISRDLGEDDFCSKISEIRNYYPRIYIIVYAAEESIQEIKKAMVNRVYHYLKTPVNKRKLIPVLIEIRTRLDMEREVNEKFRNSELMMNQCKESLDFVFIYSVLFNGDFKNDLKKLERMFQVRDRGYVIFLTFPPEEDASMVEYEQYSKIIHELTPYGYRSIIGPNITKRIILFIMEEKENTLDGRSKKMQQINLATEIRKNFMRYLNTKVAVGIGSEQTIEKLPISYEEALKSLRFDKEYKVSHVDDVIPEKRTKHELYVEQEINLMQYVRSGDPQGRTCLMDLLGMMHDYNLQDKKNKILELFVLAAHEIRKEGIMNVDYVNYIDCVEEMNQLKPEELDFWACKRFRLIAKCSREVKDAQSTGLMKRALRYIDGHFEEELTLESMAKYTNVSPQYFSKKFKEKVGMNFVDYLTKLRMNKAVEALRYTDKTIQEICYEVGYKDPNYFSRVFKKNIGISPKEYLVQENNYRQYNIE